jgi:pilus assembly protein Flp/PilA
MMPKSGNRFSGKHHAPKKKLERDDDSKKSHPDLSTPTRMVEMARKSSFLSSTRRAAGEFLADERGATAIEYALIASGISAAIISIVFGLGTSVVNNLYNKVSTALS